MPPRLQRSAHRLPALASLSHSSRRPRADQAVIKASDLRRRSGAMLLALALQLGVLDLVQPHIYTQRTMHATAAPAHDGLGASVVADPSCSKLAQRLTLGASAWPNYYHPLWLCLHPLEVAGLRAVDAADGGKVAKAVTTPAALKNDDVVPSFKIQDDRFLRDGKSTQIRSGSLHYSRVPPQYWQDRLRRMRALGLNSVTTYVPWNFHETVEGEFNFAGPADIGAFLSVCAGEGLLVILRAGPYMCGEWEFGGFPSWLLTKPAISFRDNSTS
eukprot:SAG11_NODE_569_length_8458_cov_5.574231_6_plen_272_part_00